MRQPTCPRYPIIGPATKEPFASYNELAWAIYDLVSLIQRDCDRLMQRLDRFLRWLVGERP